jgi:hypothetical protein
MFYNCPWQLLPTIHSPAGLSLYMSFLWPRLSISELYFYRIQSIVYDRALLLILTEWAELRRFEEASGSLHLYVHNERTIELTMLPYNF